MRFAQERALGVRRLYGITGIPPNDLLDQMLADWGLTVTPWATTDERFREAFIGHYVLVRAGLDEGWVRWGKAHALGHKFLHCANQTTLDDLAVGKQERQAELFAGSLIFGQLPVLESARLDIQRSASILSELASVPYECAARWWRGLHQTDLDALKPLWQMRAPTEA